MYGTTEVGGINAFGFPKHYSSLRDFEWMRFSTMIDYRLEPQEESDTYELIVLVSQSFIYYCSLIVSTLLRSYYVGCSSG